MVKKLTSLRLWYRLLKMAMLQFYMLYALCILLHISHAEQDRSEWRDIYAKYGGNISAKCSFSSAAVAKGGNFRFNLMNTTELKYTLSSKYVSLISNTASLLLKFPNVSFDFENSHLYCHYMNGSKRYSSALTISVGRGPPTPVIKNVVFLEKNRTLQITITTNKTATDGHTYRSTYFVVVQDGKSGVEINSSETFEIEDSKRKKIFLTHAGQWPSHISVIARGQNVVSNISAAAYYQLCFITRLPSVNNLSFFKTPHGSGARSIMCNFLLPSKDPLVYQINLVANKKYLTDLLIEEEIQPKTVPIFIGKFIQGLAPFTTYEASVRVRLKCSDKWSKKKNRTFVTDEDVPAMPPSIAKGGFETRPRDLGSTRDVIVYWRAIDERYKNGKIQYKVAYSVSNNEYNTLCSGTNYTITNVSTESRVDVSVNALTGAGINSTFVLRKIIIQPEATIKMIKQLLLNVTCIILDKYRVMLSWNNTPGTGAANEVTVYYTQPETGEMFWETQLAEPGITIVNYPEGLSLKSKVNLRLGYSLDNDTLSSGISWCQKIYDQSRRALPPRIVAVHSDSSSVDLQLEPAKVESHKAYIYAYNVSYCIARATGKDTCESLVKSVLIPRTERRTKARLKDLRSESVYYVCVLGISNTVSTSEEPVCVWNATTPPLFSTWSIIGIALGAPVLLVLFFAGVYVIFCRYRRKLQKKFNIPIDTPEPAQCSLTPPAYPEGNPLKPVQHVSPRISGDEDSGYYNIKSSEPELIRMQPIGRSAPVPIAASNRESDSFPLLPAQRHNVTDSIPASTPVHHDGLSSEETQAAAASSVSPYATGSESGPLVFEPLPDGPARPIQIEEDGGHYASIGKRMSPADNSCSVSSPGHDSDSSGSVDFLADRGFDCLQPLVTDPSNRESFSITHDEADGDGVEYEESHVDDSRDTPPGYAGGESANVPFEFERPPAGNPAAPHDLDQSSSSSLENSGSGAQQLDFLAPVFDMPSENPSSDIDKVSLDFLQSNEVPNKESQNEGSDNESTDSRYEYVAGRIIQN